MTALTQKVVTARPGILQRRMDRIAETGNMTVTDVFVFGAASLFGVSLPSIDADGADVNAPQYADEPSTWCTRCNAPYWSARCPGCGK